MNDEKVNIWIQSSGSGLSILKAHHFGYMYNLSFERGKEAYSNYGYIFKNNMLLSAADTYILNLGLSALIADVIPMLRACLLGRFFYYSLPKLDFHKPTVN